MCILIASVDGTLPSLEELRECERSNPHGIGIAWAWDGKLTVRKAMTLAEFLPMLFEKPDTAPYVLHFRYATHGAKNLDNCHPFTVGSGMAMAHNGILPWRSTPERSDTRCFARDIIRPNRSMVFDAEFQEHIESFVGDWNKLAFIDRDGDIVVYNEDSGHWRDGIWFSNHGYCPARKTRWVTDAEWEAALAGETDDEPEVLTAEELEAIREAAAEEDDEPGYMDYTPRRERERSEWNGWPEDQIFRDWHRDGKI